MVMSKRLKQQQQLPSRSTEVFLPTQTVEPSEHAQADALIETVTPRNITFEQMYAYLMTNMSPLEALHRAATVCGIDITGV